MRGRRGFTLIEVLVAVAVAGLALTAGVAALGMVGDRADHVEAAMAGHLSGAGARALLAEWIGGALAQAPGRGEAFGGLDAEDRGVPRDELMLPTTAATPGATGAPVVRLYVDVADSTAERGLVAEITARTGVPPRRVELVPEVDGLDIRYRPAVTGSTEWLPDWVGARGLPRAVEVVLTAAPGDSLPALLRTPLRVVVEAAR